MGRERYAAWGLGDGGMGLAYGMTYYYFFWISGNLGTWGTWVECIKYVLLDKWATGELFQKMLLVWCLLLRRDVAALCSMLDALTWCFCFSFMVCSRLCCGRYAVCSTWTDIWVWPYSYPTILLLCIPHYTSVMEFGGQLMHDDAWIVDRYPRLNSVSGIHLDVEVCILGLYHTMVVMPMNGFWIIQLKARGRRDLPATDWHRLLRTWLASKRSAFARHLLSVYLDSLHVRVMPCHPTCARPASLAWKYTKSQLCQLVLLLRVATAHQLSFSYPDCRTSPPAALMSSSSSPERYRW